MPNDHKKPSQPPNLKTLTSDWTSLINELKNQSSPKLQLPPILSQRKSPLQNYKNAKKLQQATYSKSKTVTQKILDLSKKRKLSTVNFTQDLNKIRENSGQKRSPSQIFCHLTDEEKELLASKELKRNAEQWHSVENKGKTIDNTKDIVKQIRELYEEHRCKEYERSYRDLCAKEWKKVNAKGNEKITEQDEGKGQNCKLKLFDNESEKQEKGHSIKLNLDDNEDGPSNDIPTEANHTQQPTSNTNKNNTNNNNKRLSFSISQDYKSLQNRQQFNSSLAKLFFKHRSIQSPHLNQKLTTNSHKHLTSYNQQPLNCQHSIQNKNQHTLQKQHNLGNIKGRYNSRKSRNISRVRYDGERFRFNKYEPWESSLEEDNFDRIKGLVEGELTIENYRTLQG